MTRFSGRPIEYDREAFHKYLWDNANSEGKIQVHQENLAKQLMCSHVTIHTMLRDLRLTQKIDRIQGPGQCAWFRVTEPVDTNPKARTIAWG